MMQLQASYDGSNKNDGNSFFLSQGQPPFRDKLNFVLKPGDKIYLKLSDIQVVPIWWFVMEFGKNSLGLFIQSQDLLGRFLDNVIKVLVGMDR